GDRMNVDDSDPQPFDLRLLAAGQAAPAVGSAGSAAAAASGPPVPAPGAGHAVGGVSNLTTGE
ncbi:MAG: hypothetical protein JO371_04055, partial [Paraburkholderia sp.]|nr:hypothetical protein [Paraburkholderia sp.]